MKIQERYKSPILWISFTAQAVSLLLLFKVIDLQMGETINTAVGILCQMFVGLGIFNNPTDGENY